MTKIGTLLLASKMQVPIPPSRTVPQSPKSKSGPKVCLHATHPSLHPSPSPPHHGWMVSRKHPAMNRRAKIRRKDSSTYPHEACWASPTKRINSITMKVQFQKAWRAQVFHYAHAAAASMYMCLMGIPYIPVAVPCMRTGKVDRGANSKGLWQARRGAGYRGPGAGTRPCA